jgi:trans-2,3-dihydro-3-hydroxyanthranilate isomerase
VTGPSLAYQVVDVFTGTAFAGNPLAVVLDADELSTEQLQALASEFNLSETAFPLRAPDGATYGLRIFTPSTELPWAGHPSVGSAWVLHDLGRIAAGPNVQSCGAGLLPLTVSASSVTLSGGAPSCGPPLDPAPVLAALGLSPGELAGPPPRAAGVGIDFTFLLVQASALDRVVVDPAAVTAVGSSGISLVAWSDGVARCRVFPGGVGIHEDPATGSAALGLGVYLAASGLLPDGSQSYVVEQGHEMGRPSTLRCTVVVSGCEAVSTTVSGSVVPIARGEIRVPPPRP